MVIKKRTGIVISDKMTKTITVAVQTKIAHRKYGKILTCTKKYKAHDEHETCKIGDIVKIQETRPISKTKFWKLIHKIEHN